MLDDMTWQKRDEVIARLGASTRAHDWQEWLAIGREWGMDEAQVKVAFDEANEWLLDAVSVNGNGLRELIGGRDNAARKGIEPSGADQ